MSKINNLQYAALNVSGDNYLQWALDTKIILKSKDLCECIEDDNNTTEKERYKAILLIRHHLAESLKNQYPTIENPLDLWVELRNRYGHQKTVLLPKTQFDWKNLRIQDFKTVDEYNSELFKIVSILKLCGKEVTEEDLLEKTFSTFHTNNILLQKQYRQKDFKTYASLISCLLLAEQNNELLLMNSAMRPHGSTPLPEAHKVDMTKKEPQGPKETKESNYIHRDKYHGRGRGNYQGNHYDGQGRGNRSDFGCGRGRGREIFKPQHRTKSVCHRCGMGNHWAKTCRTPKHLTDLYQESVKKNAEANLVHLDGEGDFHHEKDDLMEYETLYCLREEN